MSSFITSDQTILAIVQGMRDHNMIGYRDMYYMAGALRTINERQTGSRWNTSIEHTAVNHKLSRDFSEAEIWTSCRCWLYQVDTGRAMSLDDVSIKAGVELLADTIISDGIKAGTWKADTYLGQTVYFTRDEFGDFVDAYDLAEWDLSA